jgi:hypothetical protein
METVVLNLTVQELIALRTGIMTRCIELDLLLRSQTGAERRDAIIFELESDKAALRKIEAALAGAGIDVAWTLLETALNPRERPGQDVDFVLNGANPGLKIRRLPRE